MSNASQQNHIPKWDTSSHNDFYAYYEQQSLLPETAQRFRATRDTLLRIRSQSGSLEPCDVLDVGCGAGAQGRYGFELGHRYVGIDINEPLIMRCSQASQRIQPASPIVGSATHLPLPDNSIDICVMPELLEHVPPWEDCINEACRVLRPGGLFHISTSSMLCPFQQEFNLPLYGWYPKRLKRYYERRAVTDRPELANYAKYPAVNWFSFFSLRDYLAPKGFDCLDRFDLIDVAKKSLPAKIAITLVRLPPLRFLAT
ncbi:MAG: class I SAM-dependent methyltransferase [Betaproteobacteria bacterium]|nr:class I SAM-dependent methyltransferase [Betaproteobacteria bacterium]